MSNKTSLLDLIYQSQSGKEVTANNMFDAASPAMLFGRRASLCSGLNWFYYGGYMVVGGTPTAIPNNSSPLVLTANQNNYIEATTAGVVSSNTTGFTVGRIPLYVAVTSSTRVTDYTDYRTPGLSNPSASAVDWQSGRVYHVGQASWMYSSIQAAITAINAASPAPSVTNRVTILVWPGKYTTSATITVPSYVDIKGVSKGLVQFQNDTTDLFTCSGSNWFEDFLIEGSPTSTIYGFNCNNGVAIHIRRVDMLNNGGVARQKFLKQSGATWGAMFVENCVVDYCGTSGYAFLFTNTSGAARYCDVEINDVFSDAYHLTGYGGSFELQGVQDFRIRGCRIRGAATWNTSVRMELNGVSGVPNVTIGHSNLEGGVPIYNESGTQVYARHVYAPGSAFDGLLTSNDSYYGDTASVSVTSADVTLKGQEFSAPYLTTTGVLTGNRNVIVPTNWRGTVFCNNTGAYTTTFKTQSGTGIVVAQGKRAVLFADGTNVVRITGDT